MTEKQGHEEIYILYKLYQLQYQLPVHLKYTKFLL
jgi:hypothetical protein